MSNDYKDWLNDIETIKEYNRKLFMEKPYMNPKNGRENEVYFDYSYTVKDICETPVGWDKMLDGYFEEFQSVWNSMTDKEKDDFYFVQIKEKYGELVIHTSISNDAIKELNKKYAAISSHICAKCGKWTNHITKGYILPMCEGCSFYD